MNRREWLTSAGAVAGAGLALNSCGWRPSRCWRRMPGRFRIKAIETFNIELPATPSEIEAGVMNRTAITRVVTESGVKGYSFGGAGGGGGARRRGSGSRAWRCGPGVQEAAQGATAGTGRDAGAGLRSQCRRVSEKCRKRWWAPICSRWNSTCNAALSNYAGIEEAIWDAIWQGGGTARCTGCWADRKTTMPIYYYGGMGAANPDQSQVPIRDQAVYARRPEGRGIQRVSRCAFSARITWMMSIPAPGIIARLRPGPGFQTHGRSHGR